uniref:C-type lectin domain-containing protein n=1 Tax=Acrobeloides nanus TaxID=290746 RepID=A0A914CBE2_9BILA
MTTTRPLTTTNLTTSATFFTSIIPSITTSQTSNLGSTSIGTTTIYPDCGSSGWAYYKGSKKCFKAILGMMNYYDAVERCASLNATLASIHSEEENNFLYDLVSPAPPDAVFYSLWIGLVDHNISGRWAWLDGMPIDFLKWGHYQPDYQSAHHMNLTCTVLVITGIQKFNSYESNDTVQWDDDFCEEPDWQSVEAQLPLYNPKPGEEGTGVHDGVFCQKQLEHKKTTTQNSQISVFMVLMVSSFGTSL